MPNASNFNASKSSGYPRESHAAGARGRDNGPTATLDTAGIRFGELKPDLFDRVAQETARTLAGSGGRGENKPTQIRKFYDELVMWEEKVNGDSKRFEEFEPFIRMLNSKVAYAQSRKHVDENFVRFMNACLEQIKDARTLRHGKLFFEAVLGFFKGQQNQNNN